MDKIIILDEDSAHRENLAKELSALGCAVETSDGVDAAQDQLNRGRFDLVIAHAGRAPDVAFLRAVRATPGNPPVVLLVEESETRSGVELLGGGVCDVLVKPVAPGQVTAVLRHAELHVRRLQIAQRQFDETSISGTEVLQGSSLPLQNLLQLVRKVARTEATVLIQGEPGSGKTWVARDLHRQSSRSEAPFLSLDCSACPANRVEAELFGEESTVADGTIVRRAGLLELAEGGSLVVEEIAELPTEAQDRLQAFLTTGTFQRVGGEESVPADVRIVATTNRDLEDLVSQKSFSEELLVRLNIVPIVVPNLKERSEDIPVLVDLFRQRLSRRVGTEVLAVSAEGLQFLQSYDWPGNIQELERVVERGILASEDGGLLEASAFSLNLPAETGDGADESKSLEDLHAIEKKHIFLVLESCQGNRTHAARILGISIRTLRNKLREYRETGDIILAPTLGGVQRQQSSPESAAA